MEKTDTKKNQTTTATISLKDVYNKGRYTIRAKKSISLIRKYVCRHAKTDLKNIRIGMELNEFIWKNGIKNSPRSIQIHMYKKDKTVMVNITSVDIIGEEKKIETRRKLKIEEQKKEAAKEEEPTKPEEPKETKEKAPTDEKETKETTKKEPEKQKEGITKETKRKAQQ